MKKNKKKQSLLIIALVAVVGIMSVAFALSATTTLTATGTVTVPHQKWDVEFTDAEPDFYVNGVFDEEGTEATAHSLTSAFDGTGNTKITYSLEIPDFGERVRLMFPVKNLGDFDAVVDAETVTDPETLPEGVTVSYKLVEEEETDGKTLDELTKVTSLAQKTGLAYLVVDITVDSLSGKTVTENTEFGSENTITLTSTVTATYSES